MAEKSLAQNKREILKSILLKELSKIKNTEHQKSNTVDVKYSENQIIDKVTVILSELLKIPTNEIKIDYELNKYGLDSMGQMSLLRRINDQFEIQIEVEEIIGLSTIREISGLISETLNSIQAIEVETKMDADTNLNNPAVKNEVLNTEEKKKSNNYFESISSRDDEEIEEFQNYMEKKSEILYRTSRVKPVFKTEQGKSLLNFSNYDYLGFSDDAKIIEASKDALEKYGTGPAAAPLVGGMLSLHRELEEELINFLGKKDAGVTLFSSGYNAAFGSISGYMKEGDHIVLDSYIHASAIDGAIFSKANIHYFVHNNLEDLEYILKNIDNGTNRILVCTEGIFSGDGDYGDVKGVVRVSKKYGAKVFVDEAHSILVGGKDGRGVCAEQGVLDEVDLFIGTLSKGFSGIGGFLLAKKSISNYIDYSARNRMFSGALPASVTGGALASLKMAASKEGAERRKRLKENGEYLTSLYKGKLELSNDKNGTWIVLPIIGDEQKTIDLSNYLKEKGVWVPILIYPAAPKGRGRLRHFITCQHTKEQLEQVAKLVIEAAEKFGCALQNEKQEDIMEVAMAND